MKKMLLTVMIIVLVIFGALGAYALREIGASPSAAYPSDAMHNNNITAANFFIWLFLINRLIIFVFGLFNQINSRQRIGQTDIRCGLDHGGQQGFFAVSGFKRSEYS